MLIRLLCLFIMLWTKVESANIFAIYPVPSISHQVVFRRVTLELVKQGHNVTVITPDPAFPKKDGPDNLREIDLHDISYHAIRREMSSAADKKDIKKVVSDRRSFSSFTQQMFEIQMQQKEVQEIMRDNNTKYDLILMEEIMRPYLAVSHVIKAPVILFSSLGAMPTTFELFGMQTHPVLYPEQFDLKLYDLSLWDKVKKYYKFYNDQYQQSMILKEEHKFLQKIFGPGVPEISELYKNVHMLFQNTHPVWVDNQPVPPNVIYLGGLHQLPTKELPQDLKNYLDSSKHGVIYVSFGTNALSNMLELNKIQIITKVLGRLPYDVLWKWDQDELPGQTKNIRLSKWLPQADLLKHPKIKLFITQAGLQSTDEAITAGVPLLAFPVLGDQWYNAEKYERHGIGKKYLFEEINEEIVESAVKEIIEDKKYRENIVKLRSIINDQPLKPLERAMFWIDHIIRNKGGKHLIPASANLTWAEYYELNLILLILSIASIALGLVCCVLYISYRFFTKTLKSSEKLKKS